MKRLLMLVMAVFFVSTMAFGTELNAPVAGKAKVFVFNFLGPVTGRNPMEVFIGDQYQGKVNSSMYMEFDLEPGKYLIWSKNLNKKWFMNAEVAADKTYYIHLSPTAPKSGYGNMIPSPVLVNACLNNKKGKKRYGKIKKRLDKGNFQAQTGNTPEEIAEGQAKLQADITEIMNAWNEKWSKKPKKWAKMIPSDGF